MSSSSSRNWLSFDQRDNMIASMLLSSQGIGSVAHDDKSTTSGDGNKVYVEHNYVDHYNEPIHRPNDGSKRRGPRGGVLVPFPEKLYQMLNQIAEDGLEDVVSWQPHGRCFVVHQPEKFVKDVMPRYFSQTKLTSFQRQVNLYGFRRLTTGSDRNGYYHELFLRGRPDLLKNMTRVRVKGIGCKLAPSPSTEPNFYRLPTCEANKMASLLLTEQTAPTAAMIMAPPKTSRADSRTAYLEILQRTNSRSLQVPGRRAAHTNAVPCAAKSMPSFTSLSSLPSFHPTDAVDDDLAPLTSSLSSATSTHYLTDMQDDIISLLSSCRDLSGATRNNTTDSVVPPQTSSGGNILSGMANTLWEI